jgi:hypothetical protein
MDETTDALTAGGGSRAETKTRTRSNPPPSEGIALLLQRGGALGSGQAGATEALVGDRTRAQRPKEAAC